jgi:hypothetical protein
MAKGKVRCGACLAIFQATDYMLEPKHHPTDAGETSEPTDLSGTSEPVPQRAAGRLAVSVEPEPEQEPFEALPEYQSDSANPDETESSWAIPEETSIREENDSLDFESSAIRADERVVSEGSGAELEDLGEDVLLQNDQSNDQTLGGDIAEQTSADEDWGNTREESLEDSPLLPEPDLSFVNDEEQFERTDIIADPAVREHPQISDQGLDQVDSEEPSIDSLLDNALEDINSSVDHATNEQPSGQSFSQESGFSQDSIEQVEQPDLDDVIAERELVDDKIEKEEPRFTTEESQEPELNFDEIDREADDFGAASEGVGGDSLQAHRVDEEYENHDDLVVSDEFEGEQDFESEEFSGELSGQLIDQMDEADSTPDPLDEFDEFVKQSNSGIKNKLIAATLLILLIIGFQQIWSNRQTLAWDSTWGSSMKTVCGFLPCDLKARRDVSKIRLLQRQVAPDEEQEDMLDVKVLLINEADFAQPYPTIKITFTNTNSEKVAIKSFPASSYLSSDAQDEQMPSGTEVHIHFKSEAQADGFGFEFSFE